MTSICLNMIVKNEAARIERALASAAPHITAAVILDTGSTDDTKARILKFFVERPHIKCWIVDGPFENFSQARNLALDKARLRQSKHHAHYFLLMDADMELRVSKPDAFDGLDGQAYHMIQVAGGTSYHNTRLLHTHAAARYVGATHEYLDIAPAGMLDGADFLDHADGANRVNKIERDIRLLEDDLRTHGNSHNPRAWFYLANSYRDAGNWRMAEIAYKQRVELGGWDEEVWNAEVNLANCLKEQKIETGFIHTALKAYNGRPHRAEVLHDITKHYREKGEQHTALLFCKAGMDLKRPNDLLFVADWVYNWGFREEFSILGFYGSDADKKAAARCCNGLGLDLSVPEHVRHGARQNNRWYLRPLAEHCPSFISREIHALPQPGYDAMNPSVALHNGELRCIVRTVNYTIDGDGRYLIRGTDDTVTGENPIDTKNLLLRLNADLSTASQRPINWDPPSDPHFYHVRGLEDMRLFSWKDELWATACVRENLASGMPQQARVFVDYRDGVTTNTTYLSDGSGCEKNWMPLVDGDDLHYVYRLDTIVAGDLKKLSLSRSPARVAIDNISGGSQCIPFKNGWLCVVHEAIDPGDYRRVYSHRFAWLSPDYTLRRLSMPFCFHAQQIEFCAGLAPHPNGLDLVLSYGVKDSQAMLAQVSIEEVAAMLSDFHEG